jgi:ABC-2 type transport system ATP-binding protein
MAATQAAETGLVVESVTKVYPRRFGREEVTAVAGVSFSLEPGEIVGLLGPNGAGKTTTIKMIAGLLLPSSGRILLEGVDVARGRARAVRGLGAVLEGNRNLHWRLTARENLRYFGALKGVRQVDKRISELIDRLDLGEHVKKRVGELSRGLQQRVAIAIALLGNPRILLLDEPTLGLDVVAASEFREVVRDIARSGCGIVLTTHQMEVAQSLAQRIAIIAKGSLAALDSLEQLKSAYRIPGYEVSARGKLDDDLRRRLEAHGAKDFAAENGSFKFALPEGAAAENLYRALEPLRDSRVELLSVAQQEIDLEGIYRRIVAEPSSASRGQTW